MTFVITLCLGILIAAGALALLRVARPGISLADKMVALDIVLLISVLGIMVYSIWRDTTVFLDVLVVVSLLGFVGTITVARFIEWRGI